MRGGAETGEDEAETGDRERKKGLSGTFLDAEVYFCDAVAAGDRRCGAVAADHRVLAQHRAGTNGLVEFDVTLRYRREGA